MNTTQLISEEDSEQIQTFVEEMSERARQLPTYSDGQPKDDDGIGGYAEWKLIDGVTLVMEWSYLDIASTVIIVEQSVSDYDGPQQRLMECGDTFDELCAELGGVIDLRIAEYSESNSLGNAHLYHCFCVEPF